jgi:hypothetical protein
VASKRQIVSNRRNALVSTGPRSSGGRNRASRNPYRHGLAAGRPLDAKLYEAVKRLARKIAGGSTNRLVVQSSDLAARAHFDIAGIRELETALIEREFAFVESGEVQVRGALDLDGLAEGVDLISAIQRHIGLHVPDDEIIVSKLSFDMHGKGVGDFVIRAETKQTRLHVDFRLSALPCTL